MRYLILGAGPAGVIAAETLRQQDREAAITIIGDEPEPPYARMALPYLLAGNIDESGTHLRHGADHFTRLDIELHEARAEAVDAVAQEVRLSDGTARGYDKLLIATGSEAARPPIDGAHLDGVVDCWTMADARAIAAKARSGARVVLMGAGFIGCIVLEALAARGVQLTVIEAEPRMLPRMMDETGAAMIADWCTRKGVDVRTATRVERIEPQGERLVLSLSSGETIAADLVVSATGVRPNIGFLKGSDIACETGVVVDEHLQTSAEHVFAAGDVAEGFDFSSGARAIHAIQPTAAEHGRIAALNMAGRPARYRGSLAMNVLNTLGLVSSSFGLWQGVEGGETVTRADPERHRYLRLAFDDDRIIGALALGHTQHIGVLRGLIQSRVSLGPWKERLAENPHRLMEAYLTRTQGALERVSVG